MHSTTVPAALTELVGVDPTRPILTWYDDGTGERIELSGAGCLNWLAKTGNLLVDGCGLAGGDAALVDLPPHWQTAAVLLGCWAAGLRVVYPPPAVAAGREAGTGAPVPPVNVVFALGERAAGYVGDGNPVYGLSLAPMAAPLTRPPAGVTDYVTEVRAFGDNFTPPVPVSADDPAVTDGDGTTLVHGELCRAAGRRAAALGIPAGGRVLVDVTAHPDPLDWLLAPVLAGASMVLCRRPDPAALPDRVATERATTVVPPAAAP